MTVEEIKTLAEDVVPHPKYPTCFILFPPVRILHKLSFKIVLAYCIWEGTRQAVDTLDFGCFIPADRFSTIPKYD